MREVGISGTGPRAAHVGRRGRGRGRWVAVRRRRHEPDRPLRRRTARCIASFGHGGSDAGELRFGAGGGNAAGAGGGLAVGGSFLYVADTGNDRILRFDLDGSNPRVLVPPGILDVPQGLTIRGTRLMVADDRNHRLVVFDTGGRMLATVGAGKGSNPGQLAHPYDVASDAAGRLFVADDLNHRVVRFSAPPRYPYKARWGAYGTTPGRLAYPRGLAVGPQGQIYVANTGNDRIDVFDRGGALQASFGASGRAVGEFDAPMGVATDASGIRAVADSVNGRIAAARPGRRGPGPVGRPRARADAAARPRRGRLRRRRQRLRPRPAPRADPRVQPHHRDARAHDRRAGQRTGQAALPVGDRDRPDRARSPSPTRATAGSPASRSRARRCPRSPRRARCAASR